MWTARNIELIGADGRRLAIDLHTRPATFGEVVDAWKEDDPFRKWFNSVLADAPFDSFRWETPSVTLATQSRPFEFVLLNSPGLARHPDPQAFADHFRATDANVVTFTNLGGDATLIVPCPIVEATAYGHIAAFVRFAPPTQRDDLWQRVGIAMSQRISAKPVWLSTAGAGVSWLHVRLDDRPKYYGFAPYRSSK